jgi:hypothetical protein
MLATSVIGKTVLEPSITMVPLRGVVALAGGVKLGGVDSAVVRRVAVGIGAAALGGLGGV